MLENKFKALFENWAKEDALEIKPLPISGSSRQYYRIRGESKFAIAVFHLDKKENESFIYLSNHFNNKSLPVPKIYAENLAENIYLQEDLGNQSLLDQLTIWKKENPEVFPEYGINAYKQVIKNLIQLQTKGVESIDQSKFSSRVKFDRTAMMWDLTYFKYYFLKSKDRVFDETALEKDFETLVSFLLEAADNFFMWRDCQARNIMLKHGEPYFIDYQGGRFGALQYDLVSLLYQAKAQIPAKVKTDLIAFYLEELNKVEEVEESRFLNHFKGFVLIRLLQVLGAYGYRGYFQGKAHFLTSIPFAIENIAKFLNDKPKELHLPELYNVMEGLVEEHRIKKYSASTTEGLTIALWSFAYKNGIPADPSGNGGGFVFDCRALHNPGRYAPYKELTGRDESVKEFLKAESRIEEFLKDVKAIVSPSVQRYVERGFQNLQISFGCTGGQHRSVFSADAIAEFLKEEFGELVSIQLKHREQEKLGRPGF